MACRINDVEINWSAPEPYAGTEFVSWNEFKKMIEMPGYSDYDSMVLEWEPRVGTRIKSYMEFQEMVLIPGIEIEIICWNPIWVLEWITGVGIEIISWIRVLELE